MRAIVCVIAFLEAFRLAGSETVSDIGGGSFWSSWNATDGDSEAWWFEEKELEPWFGREGDVYIYGLFNLYAKDKTGDRCGLLRPELALWQVQAFVDVLRRRNFTLQARTFNDGSNANEVNGTVRTLRVGFFVEENCVAVRAPIFSPFLINKILDDVLDPERTPKCNNGRLSDNFPIVAMVGPPDDRELTQMTALMNSFHRVVQITPRTSDDDFSCSSTPSDDSGGRRKLAHAQWVSPGAMCDNPDDLQYLFRLAASNRFQARAIADILLHSGWSDFALVSGMNHKSKAVAFELVRILQETNSKYKELCPAFFELFESDIEARTAARLLNKHNTTKVVVLLANPTEIERLWDAILAVTRGGEFQPRIWLGDEQWGYGMDRLALKQKYRGIMQDILALGSVIPEKFARNFMKPVQDLVDDVVDITADDLRYDMEIADNPWLCAALESENDCVDVCRWDRPTHGKTPCPGDATISRVTKADNQPLVEMIDTNTMMATEVLMQAMEEMFQQTVKNRPDLEGDRLVEEFMSEVRNLSFLNKVKTIRLPCSDGNSSSMCRVFAESGTEPEPYIRIYAANRAINRSLAIGSWDPQRVCADGSPLQLNLSLVGGERFQAAQDTAWSSSFSSWNESSTCFPTCLPGFGRKERRRCCWQCSRCLGRTVSEGGNLTCRPCETGSKPNDGRSGCVPLGEYFLVGESHVQIAMATLTVAGLAVILVTAAVFWRYRKTTIARSADRVSMALLLSAMALSFITPGLLLTPPRIVGCVVQRLAYSIPLQASITIVLVKTSRLARIYFAGIRLMSSRSLRKMETPAQIALTLVLLVAGIAFEAVLIVLMRPEAIEVAEEEYFILLCCVPSKAVIIGDCYHFLLIGVMAFLAYFTRKLPVALDEARLLFLTSESICLLWIVVRSIYYISSEESQQWLNVALVMLNSVVLWMWLFLPRLYIFLFRPARRNQSRMWHSARTLSVTSGHRDMFSVVVVEKANRK